MFVFSIQTTLGSWRSFHANWPYPTSTEYTFFAPFCSMQSVNPPVEAPMSMHTMPSKEMEKCVIAFSSFRPPRLTYFNVFPWISIGASSAKVLPALSSRLLLTNTLPSIIMVFAFSRDGARPRFTRSTSNRSFIIPPVILLIFFPSRNLHPVPVLFLIRQHFHVPQSSQELQS